MNIDSSGLFVLWSFLCVCRQETKMLAMLVGLATQTNKKHTNKYMDGSTHYRIKVDSQAIYFPRKIDWSNSM